MDKNFKLPKLREDLYIDVVKQNNEELLVIYDQKGYSPQPVALASEFLPILQTADGEKTLEEFENEIKTKLNANVNTEYLVEIFRSLNEQNLLDTPKFYFHKYQTDSYVQQPTRPPVCAGSSYPRQAPELESKLERMLATVGENEIQPGAQFVIAPHIDFNVGLISHETYSSAYKAIRDSDADLFVIFGTAHFRSSHIFMLSEKDFLTPLGKVPADKEIIAHLKENAEGSFAIDETAHRYEHSVELQAVLLQYLFADRDITILPILTGAYQNFIMQKLQPNSDQKFQEFITALNEAIDKSGKKAMFIASADFAHIGRKFEDNFDAEPILPQIKDEDKVLINYLMGGNSEAFFNSVSKVNDRRKICGLSPIYSLIESMKVGDKFPYKGKLLKYNQWNEVETRSAVSFASIAYYPI